MKNFFQKKREFVALFAYALLIAALIYAVILPMISKISNIKDQIQEEAMKQESNKQRLDNLPKVQEQAKRLDEKQSEIDVLLDKNNAVVLIEKLEKLAEQSGDKITIAVQDQAPAAIKTNSVPVKNKNSSDTELVDSLPSKDYLQFKITLNGNFEGVGKFLKSLESFPYYNDIISMEIKKSDGGDATSKISTAGLIAVDPFAGGSTKNSQDVTAPNNDLLDASFVVVFYTK